MRVIEAESQKFDLFDQLETSITLGNFDGVHLGHQKLISKVTEDSKKSKRKSVVVTFSPHPAQYFSPEKPFFRIDDENIQEEKLKSIGVDFLVRIRFDRKLAEMSARDFFEDWIVKTLRAKLIVVGYDFCFGANREGDREFLERVCSENDIRFTEIGPERIKDDIISSRRVRESLQKGLVEEAGEMLGGPFSYHGEVISGDGRGKRLGFPTANIDVPRGLVQLKNGVYFTKVRTHQGWFDSISNFGFRPTFETEKLGQPEPRLESFLLSPCGEIYGQKIEVKMLKFHREEKKFSSVEELKKQVGIDIDLAKEFHKNF